MARPAVSVFLTYAHRHREWVQALRENLLSCFEAAGRPGEIFLDDADLAVARSWVSQLQAGLDRADHLLLVVTPEAMASPRVADEWQSFVAERRHWRQGQLVVAHLADTPMPPFLSDVQQVDFRGHDEAGYRRALLQLASAFPGHEPERLPAGVEVPEPPLEGLPADLRNGIFDWLEPLLKRRANRWAVAAGLGFEPKALDEHPSRRCACSAALVRASGDDDAVVAALRFLEVVEDALGEDEPEEMAALGPLRAELETLGQGQSLLGRWLERTVKEHSRLVAYFQERAELELLDQVYVKLELQTGRRLRASKEEAEPRLERAQGLEEVLLLDAGEHPWITRRWVVLGDPGSGKTTLLRHLASTLARRPDPAWVPVFESLPRLMREREPLLDRLERRMRRAGHRGLAAILDREGERGRLLLLLDGLDEVRQEDRAETEALIGDFSQRWPATPMVVASRPIGYRSPGGEFRELELLPLDHDRRRQFLSRWFGRRSGQPEPERARQALAVLDGERSLRDLAGNPLYLTLMALLLEQARPPRRPRRRLALLAPHLPRGPDCRAPGTYPSSPGRGGRPRPRPRHRWRREPLGRALRPARRPGPKARRPGQGPGRREPRPRPARPRHRPGPGRRDPDRDPRAHRRLAGAGEGLPAHPRAGRRSRRRPGTARPPAPPHPRRQRPLLPRPRGDRRRREVAGRARPRREPARAALRPRPAAGSGALRMDRDAPRWPGGAVARDPGRRLPDRQPGGRGRGQ